MYPHVIFTLNVRHPKWYSGPKLDTKCCRGVIFRL